MRCATHNEIEAAFRCQKCGRGFCGICVKQYLAGEEKVYACPLCGDKCVDISVEEKEEEARRLAQASWRLEMPRIFFYPFRSGGGGVILFSSLILGVLSHCFFGSGLIETAMRSMCPSEPPTLLPMFTYGGAALFALFFFSYLLGIVQASDLGSETPTDWDRINGFGRIFSPGFWISLAASGGLGYLGAIICRNPLACPLFWWLGLLAGIYVFPAVMLVGALSEGLSDIFSLKFFRVIGKSLRLYSSVAGAFLIAVAAACAFSAWILGRLDARTCFRVSLALSFFMVYLALILARLFGLYGRAVNE